SLPLEVKVKNLGSKLLLKRAMAGVLPRATLRRRKQAFQVPLDEWVSGSLRDFVRDVLLSRRSRERGWLAADRVERPLSARAMAPRPGQAVWTLLCLELWAQGVLAAD